MSYLLSGARDGCKCVAAAAFAAVAAGCAHADAEPAKAAAAPYSVQHYTPLPSDSRWYDPNPRSPPRLAETRTLGADDGDDGAYTDARIYVPRRRDVAVFVAPPAPAYAAPYGGYVRPVYGYGHGSWWSPPSRPFGVGPSGTPGLGGNWAPVPSFGPRFPFPAGSHGPDVTRR